MMIFKETEMRDLTNTMICWTHGTDQVALLPWPDRDRLSDAYQYTAGACYLDLQKKTFEQRKIYVFIEAMHMIIRDRCPADVVHRVLCGLAEYEDGLAPDVPRA